MSAHVLCPECRSTRHSAYTKGKRRMRATLLPGNVASRGRECQDCGRVFLVLEVPMDEPAGMSLWHFTQERHESGA
jgi:hypothetical protein